MATDWGAEWDAAQSAAPTPSKGGIDWGAEWDAAAKPSFSWTMDYGGNTLGETIKDAAKGYLKNFGSAVAYPLTLAQSGLDAALGTETPRIADAYRETLDRWFPTADSAPARVAERAGEVTGSVLGTGAIANSLGAAVEGAPIIGKAASTLGNWLSAAPGFQLISALTGGTAGGLAREAGAGEGGQLAAELGGSLLPAAPALTKGGINLIKALANRVGGEEQAGRLLSKFISSTEEQFGTDLANYSPELKQTIAEGIAGDAAAQEVALTKQIATLEAEAEAKNIANQQAYVTAREEAKAQARQSYLAQKEAQAAQQDAIANAQAQATDQQAALLQALVPEGMKGVDELSLAQQIKDGATAVRDRLFNAKEAAYDTVNQVVGNRTFPLENAQKAAIDALAEYKVLTNPTEPGGSLSGFWTHLFPADPNVPLSMETKPYLELVSQVSGATQKGDNKSRAVASAILDALAKPLPPEATLARKTAGVLANYNKGLGGDIADAYSEGIARELLKQPTQALAESGIPNAVEAKQRLLLDALLSADNRASFIAKNQSRLRAAFGDKYPELARSTEIPEDLAAIINQPKLTATRPEITAIPKPEPVVADTEKLQETLKTLQQSLPGKIAGGKVNPSQVIAHTTKSPEAMTQALSALPKDMLPAYRTAVIGHALQTLQPGTFFHNRSEAVKLLFGPEMGEQLIQMFGKKGSIGSKIFQGIGGETWKRVASSLGLAVGGTVGAGVAGPYGAAVGSAVGSAAGNILGSIPKSRSDYLVDMIRRLGRGDSSLMAALALPASKKNYDVVRSVLANRASPFAATAASETLGALVEQQDTNRGNENYGVDHAPSTSNSIAGPVASLLQTLGPSTAEAQMVEENTPHWSEQHDFPALVKAVIKQESGGNPNAVSPKGAVGLLQIMKPTFDEWAGKLGIDKPNIKDPEQNVQVGSAYLKWLMSKFSGDLPLALASYNAGIGRVLKALTLASKNGQPRTWEYAKNYLPPGVQSETIPYVSKVLKNYNKAIA